MRIPKINQYSLFLYFLTPFRSSIVEFTKRHRQPTMTANFGISSGNNVVGTVLPSSTWPMNPTNLAADSSSRSLNRTWAGVQDSPLLIAANNGTYSIYQVQL